DFPLGSSGYAGGWGDARYTPSLHACPGVWFTLGDGKDAKPSASTAVVHGDSGKSIKLTATPDGQSSLIGMHRSFPDRSGIYAGLDNAITNGKVVFEFWVYRASESSGLSAFLQDAGAEHDVGLKIAPNTGKVSYSTTGPDGQARWTEVNFA